jgi:hypothetical protein
MSLRILFEKAYFWVNTVKNSKSMEDFRFYNESYRFWVRVAQSPQTFEHFRAALIYQRDFLISCEDHEWAERISGFINHLDSDMTKRVKQLKETIEESDRSIAVSHAMEIVYSRSRK